MKTARIPGGILAGLLTLWALPVLGQRVHFPSAIPTNTAPSVAPATPPAPLTIAPGMSSGTAPTYSPGTTPAYPFSPLPTYTPGAVPSYSPPATPSYPPSYPPGVTPSYLPPATPSYPPSYPPGVAPSYAPGGVSGYGSGLSGPTATFEGTIQPPTWDPYATPGGPSPGLFPHDPFLQPPASQAYPGSEGYFDKMQRFLQEVRLDFVWMPGNGPEEFGIHDVELSGTFAIPFLYNPESPLLVTPGFAIHYWNGPTQQSFDLPPYVFDAYLDAAWNPQLTPLLGGELGFRIGVYSDFQRIVADSLRYQGHGLVVLSFSPRVQVKAGVVYLDRQRIKLLPTGGLVWLPNDDTRFEILFPDPKLAWRLNRVRNTDWWAYIRGEYGGGSWVVKDPPLVFEMDYNDLRTAVGLEFENANGLDGLFEVGVAFDREIFGQGVAMFRPNTTVFLRGGLAY